MKDTSHECGSLSLVANHILEVKNRFGERVEVESVLTCVSLINHFVLLLVEPFGSMHYRNVKARECS